MKIKARRRGSQQWERGCRIERLSASANALDLYTIINGTPQSYDMVSPATSKCTTCGHLEVHHLGQWVVVTCRPMKRTEACWVSERMAGKLTFASTVRT